MKKILLIDHSALVHRSVFAYAELEHNSIPTGGLYGYATQLSRLINELRPDVTVSCADAKPYFRSLDYPEYKGDRKRDNLLQDEFEAAFTLTEPFLELLGIPLLRVRGLEADDIIAKLVAAEQDEDSRCFVFSNDTDLHQLLRHDEVVLVRKKQKEKEYTYYSRTSFAKDYPGIYPEDWVWVDALSGGHNNLKGIKGIGPVKAYRIVKTWRAGGVHPLLYMEGKYGDQIRLNAALIELPHPFASALDFMVYGKDKGSHRDLITFFTEFGISMTPQIKEALENA